MSPGMLFLEVALRGGLAILLVCILAFAMRHRSAARRHLVWALGLTALLLLPVLIALTPPLPIELRLPAGAVPDLFDGGFRAQDSRPAERSVGERTAPLPNANRARTEENFLSRGGPAPVRENAPSRSIGRDGYDLADGLIALYAGGLLFLLMRTVEGRRQIRRLMASAEDVPGGAPIGRELDRLAGRMGVRGRLGLVLSESCAMPLVAGVIRPVLCLPAAARSWPRERREAVLLHELAHVRRRDGAWRLVADLAVALHWWNPLVWMAAHRARRCSESACDDLVIGVGVRPSSYATHLLALAAGPGSPWWAWSASGAAGGPDVLRRIDALADGGRRREPVASEWVWTAGVLCAFGLAPLAMLSPSFTEAATGLQQAPAPASPAPEDPTPDGLAPDGTAPKSSPRILPRPDGAPASSDARRPVPGDRTPAPDGAPVQLRWSGSAGTGAVFLEGTVSIDGSDGPDLTDISQDPGRAGAGTPDGIFLLFLADAVVGLRSLRVHPNAERGWTRGLAVGDRIVTVERGALARAAPWLETALDDAGRKLGRLGDEALWAGAPLSRAAETASGDRLSGSLMSGAPAVSRDPDAGTFVAGWTEGTTRLGAFGRVRGADDGTPPPADRLPDLDEPAPGEWLVVFGWDRESRELRVLEVAAREGAAPLRRYSVNGTVRPFATTGRQWVEPLLPHLRALIDF